MCIAFKHVLKWGKKKKKLIDCDEEEKEIDKSGHNRDIYKHGFIVHRKKSINSEQSLVLNFTILEFDD